MIYSSITSQEIFTSGLPNKDIDLTSYLQRSSLNNNRNRKQKETNCIADETRRCLIQIKYEYWKRGRNHKWKKKEGHAEVIGCVCIHVKGDTWGQADVLYRTWERLRNWRSLLKTRDLYSSLLFRIVRVLSIFQSSRKLDVYSRWIKVEVLD